MCAKDVCWQRNIICPFVYFFHSRRKVERETDKRLGRDAISESNCLRASQRTPIFIPALAKSHFTFASLFTGQGDWKSILNIPFTPQRSQSDISTEKKLTPYYLLEVYKLTTVQFDNWEIQLALCEAGKMDFRGDGIRAMTFRQTGQ